MFFFFIMIQFSCNKSLDDDGDGFDELSNDCDDNNPDIHPDAIEQCDGIDNNCNREIDELGATGGRIWYIDLDRDGYGDAGQTIEACTQPEGYAENKWDCNESQNTFASGLRIPFLSAPKDRASAIWPDSKIDEIRATSKLMLI